MDLRLEIWGFECIYHVTSQDAKEDSQATVFP